MPPYNSSLAVILSLLVGAAAFAAPLRQGRIFFSEQWPDHARIFSMNPDGSDVRCLTLTSDTDYHPALSPDGKSVAFTSHRDGVRALYVMRPDGKNQQRLTRDGDAGLCAWSPDGRRLAFSSNRTGPYCIYVMDADGAHVRRLTLGPSDDCPAWSPDGRRLAFQSRQNRRWRVCGGGASASSTPTAQVPERSRPTSRTAGGRSGRRTARTSPSRATSRARVRSC